ncbi:MAG: hypothetical protein MUC73_12605 [Cyclobacteriaceae bacterium]|jgi:hypothetical protein|nr:hypothetical protein [Cyclobacteriaceae bacterium]
MKQSFINIFIVALIGIQFIACKPRIDMDLAQWGDKAIIDNVRIFNIQLQDQQLQEYYTSGVLTPASRRTYVSTGNAIIDLANFKATVTVPSTIDLTKTGIEFFHRAVNIEPVNGAPIAGIINDFSAKQFVYKVYSADGVTREWTVIIKN